MNYENQKQVEILYSKSNIEKAIRKEITDTDGSTEIITQGVWILSNYVNTEYSYESKNKRVSFIKHLDYREIVLSVLSSILILDTDVLFTQIIGQLANKLGFNNRADGIKTMSEIVSVLTQLDLYDIVKASKYESLYLRNNVQLSEKLHNFIRSTKYLPPMICNPRILKTNHDSANLIVKDSLILGKGNFHDGDVCLDSINRFNQIPLSLNVEFLKTFSEPPLDFDTPEKRHKWELKNQGEKWEDELEKRIDQWKNFVMDSYKVCKDLIHQGNEFYLPHKPDTRGRTYSQGYHVNYQGNSFRKACIEFHDTEIIEGF